MARDIERTQTAEIAQLRAAAARLGADPDSPAGGMGSGMGSETDLAEVSDEQFDRAFLEAMIPHHRMGVHMARMVQETGSDQQIAALAAEMVRIQTQSRRPPRGIVGLPQMSPDATGVMLSRVATAGREILRATSVAGATSSASCTTGRPATALTTAWSAGKSGSASASAVSTGSRQMMTTSLASTTA